MTRREHTLEHHKDINGQQYQTSTANEFTHHRPCLGARKRARREARKIKKTQAKARNTVETARKGKEQWGERQGAGKEQSQHDEGGPKRIVVTYFSDGSVAVIDSKRIEAHVHQPQAG